MRTAARAALAPAVDSLLSGKSLVIAPEGTRSPTPKLLPFKKGAFHLAMQAGVPMVPIVMRNAGEMMPAHSILIAPGTVQVAVLPPVSDRAVDPQQPQPPGHPRPPDVPRHPGRLARLTARGPLPGFVRGGP